MEQGVHKPPYWWMWNTLLEGDIRTAKQNKTYKPPSESWMLSRNHVSDGLGSALSLHSKMIFLPPSACLMAGFWTNDGAPALWHHGKAILCIEMENNDFSFSYLWHILKKIIFNIKIFEWKNTMKWVLHCLKKVTAVCKMLVRIQW